MLKKTTLAIMCLIVCTWTIHAQAAAINPGLRLRSEPSTAVEVLEGYIEQRNPGLEDPNKSTMRGFLIGGSVLSAGCAGLALIPTISDWGPEGEEDSYWGGAALGGFFQGLYLNTAIGTGLSYFIFPEVDIRAEYGSLLDLEEEDREDRAVLILRKIAKKSRQRGRYGALIAVLSTALPVGAYYLGSALIGPNPNVENVGYGYALGIGTGALTGALMFMVIEIGSQRIDEPFRDTRQSGSEK